MPKKLQYAQELKEICKDNFVEKFAERFKTFYSKDILMYYRSFKSALLEVQIFYR